MLLKILLVFGTILFAFPADAETRLALIISNAAYPSEIGRLANPHKDGAVIAVGSELRFMTGEAQRIVSGLNLKKAADLARY